MAKFLNKKEQVIDFKLTSYGNYLLSVGDFSPTYYAFLDDNILYDSQYASAHSLPDAQATATITVDNAAQIIYTTPKDRVTLTTTDGTEVYVDASTINTYMYPDPFAAPEKLNQGTFEVDISSGTDTATNMATVLNSHPKLSATSDGSVVTVEQVAGGASGNTDVVLTQVYTGGLSKTNFTGGNTATTATAPTSFERQNDIHERIKDNTSYLEGLVLFDDVETQPYLAGSDVPQLIEEDEDELGTAASAYFEADITPTKMIPRKDAYRMQAIIGDAFLDGIGRLAPSWKIIALQGEISSSSPIDGQNKVDIPQLNINVNYTKKVIDFKGTNVSPNDVREIEATSTPFSDGKSIALIAEDALFYVEEVNTELLTENFDIEVFETLTGSANGVNNVYKRKYFQKEPRQVVDGYMIRATNTGTPDYALTTSSIGYYFDVLVDFEVGRNMACRGVEEFNKQSYYIDLDFDCTKDDDDEVYYDIYGRVTEPEIC